MEMRPSNTPPPPPQAHAVVPLSSSSHPNSLQNTPSKPRHRKQHNTGKATTTSSRSSARSTPQTIDLPFPQGNNNNNNVNIKKPHRSRPEEEEKNKQQLHDIDTLPEGASTFGMATLHNTYRRGSDKELELALLTDKVNRVLFYIFIYVLVAICIMLGSYFFLVPHDR